MQDKVRALISADKLEKAIEELLSSSRGNDELRNELQGHSGALAKIQRDVRRGLITSQDESTARNRIRYALLEALHAAPSAPAASAAPPTAPTVFISYNHADSTTADQIKTGLEKHGLSVRIDRAVMEAGANIQSFIEDSVRTTDATVSIVSNRSLLSAWVAMESIYTFHQEKFGSGKKFIACYLDDDFFRNDFRIAATKKIDAQIKQIDKLVLKYIAQKIDTNDLNDQKTRLFKLRNDLGDILQRLRGSLCLDLRGDNLNRAVEKMAREIMGAS